MRGAGCQASEMGIDLRGYMIYCRGFYSQRKTVECECVDIHVSEREEKSCVCLKACTGQSTWFVA